MTRTLFQRRPLLCTALACLASLAVSAAPAASQSPVAAKPATVQPVPPPEMARGAKPAATFLARIEPMDLGALLIEFGRTRLDDIRKSGGGVVGVRSEPGKAQRWLCYTSRPDRQVWLTAADPASGAVNGVTLISHLGVEGKDSCPQLPHGLLPIGAIAGVSIGDKRDYVESLLGPSRGAEWVTYQTCPKAAAPSAPSPCLKIVLRFEKNRVFLINAVQGSPT